MGRGAGLLLICVGALLVLYAAYQAFSIVMSPEGRGTLPSFLMTPGVRDFLDRFSGDTRDIIENCILAIFLLVIEGAGVELMALGIRPFSGGGRVAADEAVMGKP